MTGAAARRRARIAGVLYLFIVVVGVYVGLFVRSALVMPGDPAATAARILTSETAYRWAAAAELLMWAFDVAVTLLLYELLRPVGKTLALLAAMFRFVCIVVLVSNSVNHFAPLGFLGGAAYMSALGAEETRAMAQFALRMHATGYNIGLVYFGFHCLILGYLVARSGFWPRALGWLVVAAGAGYLVNSFAGFVAPRVAALLVPWSLLPALVAEAALSLWLLFVGLSAQKWDARTKAESPA